MLASPTPPEKTASTGTTPASEARVRPELGCILVAGTDATAFLNGQFTSDLASLTEGTWTWGGYCSPKGRLLATVRAGRHGAGWALQAPTAIVADLTGRLRRFVLPAGNAEDLEEIPPEVRDALEMVLVADVDALLAAVL